MVRQSKVKFVNGWKSKSKQLDKFSFIFRFGWFTLIEVQVDILSKKFRLGLFNLFLEK